MNSPPWDTTFARWLVHEVDRRAGTELADLPLLSVSEYRGVVPRRSDGTGQQASEDVAGYKVCQPDDIVLNRLWAFRGGIGRSSMAGLVSPDYAVLRPRPGTHPVFLHYLFRSSWFVGEMSARLRGIGAAGTSAGRKPRLNVLDFGTIPVCLPTLEEQRRIAAYLESECARLDRLISAVDSAVAYLDERDEALVYSAVTRATGAWTPIRHLARYVNGFPFKPEDQGTVGLPIVRIAQLLDPTVHVDRYSEEPASYCHIDTGDIIFSWSATLAVRCWDRGPAYLNQHLFKVLPARGIDARWLYYALQAAIRDLGPFMHGSTMSHITKPMMSAVGVPMPSLDEQRSLASDLDDALEETARMRAASAKQRALLLERKQALITAAVTGELTV